MSKADKMFEELGFVKTETVKRRGEVESVEIDYKQNEWLGEKITFYNDEKSFDVNGRTKAKTVEAIVEKLKELGWIE